MMRPSPLFALIFLIACEPQLAGAPEASTEDAIGGSAAFATNVLPVVVNTGGCSGTVIGPRHILTASHCGPRTVDTWSWLPWSSTQSVWIPNPSDPSTGTMIGNVVGAISYLEKDAEILLLDRDTGIEPVRILDEPIDSWIGRRVFASGFGAPTVAGSRGAWMTIRGFTADGARYELGGGGDNASICQGDSGGPDFANLGGRWYVVGVHKSGAYAGSPECNNGTLTGSSTRLDRGVATWIRSLVPVRDHFRYSPTRISATKSDVNLDGATDFIVTTAAETALYQAISGGAMAKTWTAPGSMNWTLGRAETALAEFTGDSRADLVVLTPYGLSIFRANGASSFDLSTPFYRENGDPSALGHATQWTNQIGLGDMTIGEFNGDGRADILITDVNGTRLLVAGLSTLVDVNLGVTSPAAFAHRVYDTTVTVADFNGDAIDDVFFQDASGGSIHVGVALPVGQGNLSAVVWSDARFVRGSSHLVPGRFVNKSSWPGLSSTPGLDLLVTWSGGTSLYVSNGGASVGFSETWVRADLLPNESSFVAGDYDDDGLDDVMIQTVAGSYLYKGTGNMYNPWISNIWTHTALTIENTAYTFVDFTGEGRADLWISRPEASYGYGGSVSGLVPNLFTLTGLRYQHFALN